VVVPAHGVSCGLRAAGGPLSFREPFHVHWTFHTTSSRFHDLLHPHGSARSSITDERVALFQPLHVLLLELCGPVKEALNNA
jgi:hypothetical protein